MWASVNRGPVGSGDNMGRDKESEAQVGIECFGRAGENRGGT